MFITADVVQGQIGPSNSGSGSYNISGMSYSVVSSSSSGNSVTLAVTVNTSSAVDYISVTGGGTCTNTNSCTKNVTYNLDYNCRTELKCITSDEGQVKRDGCVVTINPCGG